MLAAFEVLSGFFLLWYSFFPFQNLELMTELSIGMIVLLLTAFVIRRNRELNFTSLFFHFCFIFAYAVQASMADGQHLNWFLIVALTQWAVVLWFHCRQNPNPDASTFFLLISSVSPLFFWILHVRDDCGAGVPFLMLLAMRICIGMNQQDIQLPWYLKVFLFWILISIPFSYYFWRSFQFLYFIILCICAYQIAGKDREAFLLGYLHIAFILVSFAVWNVGFLLANLGAQALTYRLAIVMHDNDLVPVFLILSAILLHFAGESANTFGRRLLLACFLLVICLLFFTYSRNGWVSFLLFLGILAVRALRKKAWSKVFVGLAIAGAIVLLSLFMLAPVRSTISFRTWFPINARIFTWRVSVETLMRHPLTGVGWLNYYAHTSNLGSDPLDLGFAQQILTTQTHSLFLDLSEAGGIPLAILFYGIVLSRIYLTRSATIQAGLVALTISSLFDSASFWIPSHLHFWTLIGFAGSTEERRQSQSNRNLAVRYVLTFFLFVGSFLPLAENHALTYGSFFHRIGNESVATWWAKTAGIFSPLDVRPLELIRDIQLSIKNLPGAELVLERLTRIKRDFPVYFCQKGRIAIAKNQDARRYLSKAIQLDPLNSLRGPAYLYVAALAHLEDSGSDFKRAFCDAVVRPFPDVQDSFVMDSLQFIPDEKILESAMSCLRTAPKTERDRQIIADNLYSNLLLLHRKRSAQELLMRIVQDEQEFSDQSIRDYFRDLLAKTYFEEGNKAGITQVMQYSGEGINKLMEARIFLLDHKWDESLRDLRRATEILGYSMVADDWEQYFLRTGQEGRLRYHYRLMMYVPTWASVASWEQGIGESFFREKRYQEAAKSFRRLSLYDYSDPMPHWWEARLMWLSGDTKGAEQANNRLLTLLPSNRIVKNLYRSEIESSPGQLVRILRIGLPNDIGGISWRTGIYMHPECIIKLPLNLRFRLITSEAAMIWGAWFEQTDGVQCSIRDQRGSPLVSLRITPHMDLAQRRWIPFEWKGVPQPVILETSQIGDANYDWTLWSIQQAE